MNKPYFCRDFFLIDSRHKRLKNTTDLLLFYEEHLYGFSESDRNVLYMFKGAFWTLPNVYNEVVYKNTSRFQKHSSRAVLRKKCSEKMQQIYRRTPMSKCDFNKNRTSAWVFSCNVDAFFQNNFF